MKRRKVGALLLAAAMAVSVLSGCGGDKASNAGGGDSSSSSGEAGGSAGEGEVVELTFFTADGTQDDPWTDPVAEALTAATGVKLKTSYPVGGNDESEQIALMIAEQNFPDIIYAKGSGGSLIEAGAMMDMTDLIEEHGPNIKKLYGEEFDKLKQSVDDPAIYQLSAYAVGGEKFKHCGTAQVQWDVLKANGYKLPDTLEEFEKMIKDYLEANPTTEAVSKPLNAPTPTY